MKVEIVGVRFKSVGKIYYFGVNALEFKPGDYAIVETVNGTEMGEVVLANRFIDSESLSSPLKNVQRRAGEADFARAEENKVKEKDACRICLEKINQLGLEMKIVNVQYTFDRSKILFFFTADGRVDFRELVKALATALRTRIELRQIGVRDEAKMLGGLGICGRALCCSSFLDDFEPVSVKMAKEQGISLNPAKISGSCGRLMCCLKYEQETYEQLLKHIPKVDAIVKTADGKGVVIDYDVLKGTLRIKLDKPGDLAIKTYHSSDVVVLKDGVAKGGDEDTKQLKSLE